MLVAVQSGADGQALSGVADDLARLLRSWGPGPDHLPGLALVGIRLPSRRGPRRVDALVFTPSGLVVLGIGGFTRPQPGTLTVPAAGPWLVDGVPAAVGDTGGFDPGKQVEIGVDAAKNALTAVGGGASVTGLVVLVPRGPGLVLGDTRNAGHGIHVVLADRRGLRRIIRQHNRRSTVWSVDGVLDACYALSLAHLAPPRADLRADGFPIVLPAPVPSRRAVPVALERDARPAPASRPAEADPVPRIPFPRSPSPAPPARLWQDRPVPWGLIAVLTVLVALGVAAAVFVAQVFHGG